MKKGTSGRLVQRHDIAYDPTLPTLYGGPAIQCCPPLFDLGCSDGSVGIFHNGGEFAQAMSWFGIRRARAVREELNYLQFMGGVKRGSGDTSQPGVPETICGPGDCTTWGAPCIDAKTCFGLIKTCSSPVVDGGNSLPYCLSDPRATIDGLRIDNDEEWHMANMTETMWNLFVYNLMYGVRNVTTDKLGHYGLWSLLGGYGDVRDYVYPCDEMRPHILNWNGNDACSATALAGITLDGVALADDFRLNIFHTLRAILRALMRQIGRTRGLTANSWNYGDWALMGPSEAFDCLIQCAVCFTECANNCLNLDTERAALMIKEMRTSGIGWGELNFDGFRIPLIPFDPTIFEESSAGVVTKKGSLVNPDGTFNFMLLYRGSGNNRVLQPEYNPLDDGTLDTSENGMFQWIEDRESSCVVPSARMEWRWEKRAPFLNVLIKNVKCEQILPNSILSSPLAAINQCTTPPHTAFASTPAATVPIANPSTFTFFSDNPSATFECSLDAAAFAPCASPVSLTGLALGAHTYEVRAVTPDGQVDATPASYTWTIV